MYTQTINTLPDTQTDSLSYSEAIVKLLQYLDVLTNGAIEDYHTMTVQLDSQTVSVCTELTWGGRYVTTTITPLHDK